MTDLLGLVRHLLTLFIAHSQQLSLFIVDHLELLLLISHSIVDAKLIFVYLLLELIELLVVFLCQVGVLVLLGLQLLLLLLELLVARQDVVELGELVRMVLLDFLKEFLVALHLDFLGLDASRFLMVHFEARGSLLNLLPEHFNSLRA